MPYFQKWGGGGVYNFALEKKLQFYCQRLTSPRGQQLMCKLGLRGPVLIFLCSLFVLSLLLHKGCSFFANSWKLPAYNCTAVFEVFSVPVLVGQCCQQKSGGMVAATLPCVP